MPTEDELRDLFAKADAPNRLDASAVIRRSRARRLPRQIAAGTVGALAVAGISVLTLQAVQAPPVATSMMAGEAFDESAPAPELDAIKRAPADKINLCTGTLTEVAPSMYGLQLDMEFPAEAATGSGPVAGTVRLTNTSSVEVVGTTAASPAVTLSQGGTVLWHSNGAMIMSVVEVDLQPGESLVYDASFVPVACGVEDDLGESFRDDLPAVPAGDYQLSALIDFTADASMGQQVSELDLVSGPVSTISLR